MNELKKLHPNVVPYWRVKSLISMVIGILFSSIPFVIKIFWLNNWVWLTYASSVLIAYFVLSAVFFVVYGVNVKYARRSYRLSDDEIMIQWGSVWSDNSTIIPMNRVQHVDKEQGIIAKKYGVSEIAINTAGESHYIVGLLVEDAQILREEIIKLAKLGDKGAYHDE